MKQKKKHPSSGPHKRDKRSISMKGTWKAIELDPSLFSEEGLEGLVCFEELTDYGQVDSKKAKAEKKKAKKRKVEKEAEELVEDESKEAEHTAEPAKKKAKKKKNKKVAAVQSAHTFTEVTEEEGQTEVANYDIAKDSAAIPENDAQSKAKKKKKKSKQISESDTAPEEKPSLDSPAEPPPSEKQQSSPVKVMKPPIAKTKNWTYAALRASDDKNTDMSAWKGLFVPSSVLKALSNLGFGSPTPIQALALPSAIRDHMDILGAAETGSGKTLAFGIPMIHTILELKRGSKETDENNTEAAKEVESVYLQDAQVDRKTKEDQDDVEDLEDLEEDDEDNENKTKEDSEEDECDSEGKDEDEQLGCVKVIENADFNVDKSAGGHSQPLLGLVLTPTRELAVQVKHHIDAVAKFTGIKTAIVVGGMSQQKQRRLLKHRPEIVIATPGRLWDLIKEQHPHLLNLRQLRCLVIDEADRMVERGHFAELESLLEMLSTTHFNPMRQTFVFSATLTMAHSLPTRILQKKKKNLDQRNRVEILMEKVGIKNKPKIIDLTRKEATVETLTETQIHCQKEDKDFYLYYFLLQYPGRSMVFANSIDCIKRLNALLVILDCTPLPLHANMHQKQRLKNLERFAEKESCVLLTTDVAARGLDIPNVQHVIHYQVPRTSETYVHRSGRTARATKEGLSLLLISPDDMMNFKKIYKTLGKDEELPVFPIETKCLEAIKERVNLARQIEKVEYHNGREKQHDSWFKRAAEAMDIDLDDDLLLGTRKDEDTHRQQQKMVKGMKKHLKHLISQPIFRNVIKTKYPTEMGKLLLPNLPLPGKESALTRVSMQGKKQGLKKNVPKQWRKQKQNKEKQQ